MAFPKRPPRERRSPERRRIQPAALPAGRGFVVRDLPWSQEKLRALPPFEFENWAVIALGGIPNKAQVGDMGIDGRIYPVHATPKKTAGNELAFMDDWYPIQVKQKDKAGRPDIDSFEAVMTREDRAKGFFVAFDYSGDAMTEIDAFFRKSGKIIVALTVKDILDEQLARKLAFGGWHCRAACGHVNHGGHAHANACHGVVQRAKPGRVNMAPLFHTVLHPAGFPEIHLTIRHDYGMIPTRLWLCATTT